MSKRLPKKIIFVIFLLIFALVKAMRIVAYGGWIYWQEWLMIAWFVWGAAMGRGILFFDRIVDVYYINPETELAVWTKKYLGQKQYKKAIDLLNKNVKLQKNLFFRSALFQIIWVILGVFAIFSTRAFLGQGLVLGMGLGLLLDEWSDYGIDKKYLKDWLFWQINKDFSDKELKNYLLILTGVWLVLFGKVLV